MISLKKEIYHLLTSCAPNGFKRNVSVQNIPPYLTHHHHVTHRHVLFHQHSKQINSSNLTFPFHSPNEAIVSVPIQIVAKI